MHVLHSVPETETEHHCQTGPCPCDPAQHVTAAPGKQPVVNLIHRSMTVHPVVARHRSKEN